MEDIIDKGWNREGTPYTSPTPFINTEGWNREGTPYTIKNSSSFSRHLSTQKRHSHHLSTPRAQPHPSQTIQLLQQIEGLTPPFRRKDATVPFTSPTTTPEKTSGKALRTYAGAAHTRKKKGTCAMTQREEVHRVTFISSRQNLKDTEQMKAH